MGRNAHYNIASDFADNASPLFTGVCVEHLKGNPMTASGNSLQSIPDECVLNLKQFIGELFVEDIEDFCKKVVKEVSQKNTGKNTSLEEWRRLLKEKAWSLRVARLRETYGEEIREFIEGFNLISQEDTDFVIEEVWKSIEKGKEPSLWLKEIKRLATVV